MHWFRVNKYGQLCREQYKMKWRARSTKGEGRYGRKKRDEEKDTEAERRKCIQRREHKRYRRFAGIWRYGDWSFI